MSMSDSMPGCAVVFIDGIIRRALGSGIDSV